MAIAKSAGASTHPCLTPDVVQKRSDSSSPSRTREPLPKSNYCISKAMICESFRGIAISPIILKLFEYCFIEKFGEILSTDNKQFGFKKGMGCNHAIFAVRQVVDRFIKGGNTVNLCSIDLSKAFDKVIIKPYL